MRGANCLLHRTPLLCRGSLVVMLSRIDMDPRHRRSWTKCAASPRPLACSRGPSHAGLIDTTRILLVPDHGHRAVQEHGNLRAILAEAGVTAAQNPRRRRSRGHPLALTSGDSSALIYGIDALGADRMLALLRRLALSPAIGLAFWREGDRQSYVADRRGMSRIEYCDAVSARYGHGGR